MVERCTHTEERGKSRGGDRCYTTGSRGVQCDDARDGAPRGTRDRGERDTAGLGVVREGIETVWNERDEAKCLRPPPRANSRGDSKTYRQKMN
jgi:hypothetical protein